MSNGDKPFKDKVGLVTGSARGIGRSIAEDLADWGANIVVLDVKQADCDKTAAEIADRYKVKAIGLQCNVVNKDEASAAADKVKTEMGTVNFLINNAGIIRDNLLIRMKEEEWDLVIDVNLKGPFVMTQAFLRLLMKAEPARVVNISSVSGLLGQVGQANYSSSKAGLLGFTRVVAREYASKGILCNAICPGFIQTDMTGSLDEKVQEELKKMIPVGRAGQVKDISRVVRFLCSEDSGYITGNVIRVDGGSATGI
ncbi:MAG: beta-ketoacyl-ACP reductase [Spirochaetales bacterium]|nr:beta-ketoacyl-ACP reductase [Leptospiraceae bacterium]MCP5480188.1 beta-ketoacyl-ACP reductase [Spirochaetales bacterium]MCP5485472.1 beta-ketoacyl-ACP reductase [Spirochaetales bacterium]